MRRTKQREEGACTLPEELLLPIVNTAPRPLHTLQASSSQQSLSEPEGQAPYLGQALQLPEAQEVKMPLLTQTTS